MGTEQGVRDIGRGRRYLGAARRIAATFAAVALLVVSLAPSALAASGLTLSTSYPAVAVAPGSKVSFDINVTSDKAGTVRLTVDGAGGGWDAALHGGGYVVDAVQSEANKPTTVRLDVSVPADANGTKHFTVTGNDGSRTSSLGLDVRVSTQAAGDVTLTTDIPELKGPSDGTYPFSLTLNNNTAEDIPFAVTAAGPDTGWNITTTVGGQSQAASTIVKSGSTTSISVSVKPPASVGAGTYPITVDATGGNQKAHADLKITITGSYTMTVSTPDNRLNTHGNAGSTIQQQLTLENTGTAPLTNIALTSTPPTGWTVTFNPAKVDSIDPKKSVTVTANIVPSSDAIAGDYVVTMTASNDQVSGNQDIRVTVETSLIQGFIGVILILAVLVALYFVFRRYGRR